METSDWVPYARVREESRTRNPWLTVEWAAYAGLALLAAALRFAHLGLRPLSEAEAAQALAAWRFTQGAAQTAPAGTVPALFTGNVVTFTFLSPSDAIARWLPALTGVILVLLPYVLRHRLGRAGALAASLLLALSPTAVYFSRSLDGAILVAAASLAVAVSLFAYLDSRRPAYLFVAAVALGIGLAGGPSMVTVVAIWGVYGLWLYVSGRWLGHGRRWEMVAGAWVAAREGPGLLARLGLVLAATFGVIATTFLLHPAGIGLAADLLGAWLWSFGSEPRGLPASYPLLLIVRYEALPLLFGFVEALRWVTHRRAGTLELDRPGLEVSHTGFLAFWAAAGLVALMAGHRPPGNVLLVAVPLALLAGQGMARAWRWVSRRANWAEAAIMAGMALVLIVFLYLQLTRYTLTVDASTVSLLGITLRVSTGFLLLALLGLALLMALGAIAWYWRGAALLVAAGWLSVVAVLALSGFRGMWSASFSRAADPREVLNVHPITPDIRRLAAELEKVSLARTGDLYALPVRIDPATGPAVAWVLRDFYREATGNLAAEAVPSEAQAAVTLTTQEVPLGGRFRGQDFMIRTAWSPWSLSPQPLVRWLLLGEAGPPDVEQQVVLWVAEEGQ